MSVWSLLVNLEDDSRADGMVAFSFRILKAF